MPLLPVDWGELFAIKTPVLELMLRGSLLYLCVLAIMRILPRRTGGEVAHMDLIVMLLVAEGATHSLGGYTAVTEGVIVIGTLMGLDYLLNYLSFRFRVIERLVSSRPLEIVRDGKQIQRNMAREFLTEEELYSHLRQNGITDLGEVRLAIVEGKGRISIIPYPKSD